MTSPKTSQKRFYLVSVDILQGLSIFLMVMGHTLFWWDDLFNTNWPDIEFTVALVIAIAIVAHPCFFFIYSFNVGNSLLLKETDIERRKTRHRLIKRTIIFILIAELLEGVAALVMSPKHLLNFLLTWELFHMFALSTLFLLVVFEFAWQVEKRSNFTSNSIVITVLLFVLVSLLMIFLIYHDYANAEKHLVYVNLNINSILKRIFFEEGQNPIIPWLSFSVIGGLLATFLDLPHGKKEGILKKSRMVIIGGSFIIIIGSLFLSLERYTSTPLLYSISSSFLFIAIGILILITPIMIVFLDIDSLYSTPDINRLSLPLVLVSNISLTVYIFHNIGFIIPPEFPFLNTFISIEIIPIVIGFLYSMFFVCIAFLWKKSDFKYSLEWIIIKLQNISWRWWI
ncbi:MAG: hypothetical protein ACFFB2_09265 [Promethearchaeota archaeon]